MHSFDTILFDLDGTLVDTALDLTASLNHALGALGRPAVPPHTVRSMVGHGARKLLERGLAATGPMNPELVEAGFPLFMDYYASHIADHSKPFDGVETALERLAAAGYRLGVCTNKPEGLARQLLEALGWTSRFHALTGADTFPYRKPDPRHLTGTLHLAGGSGAIFIGDSKTDADTAIAARVPLILVTFGYSSESVESLGADRLIGHFDELWAAICSLGHEPAIQSAFMGQAPTDRS